MPRVNPEVDKLIDYILSLSRFTFEDIRQEVERRGFQSIGDESIRTIIYNLIDDGLIVVVAGHYKVMRKRPTPV